MRKVVLCCILALLMVGTAGATTYHIRMVVDGSSMVELTAPQIFACSFAKNGMDDILLAPVDEFPGFVTADAILIDEKNTRYRIEGNPTTYTTALPVNGSALILPEPGAIVLNGKVIRVREFAIMWLNITDIPPLMPPWDTGEEMLEWVE